MEELALDRGVAEHVPLVRLEAVEARREQRLDRRGHVRLVPVLADHREHLLDKEGIALGGLGDPRPSPRFQVRAEVVDQRFDLVVPERLEQDRRRVELATGPRRARIEQLGACDAEEQDRRVTAEVGHVLEQVEERRLGPLDVVEEHDEWTLCRCLLEELAGRPGGLLGRADLELSA